MPAGEIRAGDVADFAALDEAVESAEGLFDGRGRVEAVHVVDVDVIGAEATEAGFNGFEQVEAGGANVVDVGADSERGFGGDEELVAAALDGLAGDFFGEAVGIDVGGVEHVEAGVEADVYEAGGFGHVARAPGFEEFVAAAECAGAEA